MEFLNNIYKSIYSPTFYREILQKPFSYSMKNFWLFILILALLGSIFLSFGAISNFKNIVDNFVPEIINFYPQDLQITIKSGEVETNVQEPYFINIPKEVKDDIKNQEMTGIENFLVINTKEEFNLERFQSYKTFALLTKNSLISYKDNGINIQVIDKNINFIINKDVINNFYQKIKPFSRFIYPAIPVLIYLGVLFIMSSKLIYLFFGALAIWILASIKGLKIKYWKAYQLSLHLIVPIILIESIAFVFKIDIWIPFLPTAILVIFASLNINKNNIEKNQ